MTDISGRRYPPPQSGCIYCGGWGPKRLSDEHILPLALGGSVILPKASCGTCAAVTGRFEQEVLRGGLRGIKERLQFPSRRARPKTLPLFFINGEESRKVQVRVEDYPAVVMLPQFVGPQIAHFSDSPVSQKPPWLFLPAPDMKALKEKYGVQSFALPAIDSGAFGRMLAKIAHGAAVAEFGTEGFVAFLPDVILSPPGAMLLRMVGSIEGTSGAASGGEVRHSWRLVNETGEGQNFLTAHIRLFTNLGAPTYRVVVGQLREHFQPLQAFAQPWQPGASARRWRLVLSTDDAADESFTPVTPHGQFTAR